ncbi:hypothetical protein RA210_U30305 [Rubrivivax sp. A210]|uniref:hypothetical protein n=1 Tax=Rubrivivax sp. A210 TaxID=2772301 RepID=UPI0019188815|nr:hypothetical protein [Rubrivivax sp. A210]CAD5373393.1 hypothetical protein RA210_U30305 [Rubrivivax sp. A210]
MNFSIRRTTATPSLNAPATQRQPEKRGPVELQPQQLAQVAGGSPKGGWSPAAVIDSPKGGWSA